MASPTPAPNRSPSASRPEVSSGGSGFFRTVLLLVLPVLGYFSIYQVSEGYVGVTWRAGALLNVSTSPGLHLQVPFLDHVESVQVTMQTDAVENIPCGTSGGVMVFFNKIEVVNQLSESHVISTVRRFGTHYDKIWIFDKIHHEINQFCSKHSLQNVYIDLFDTLDESLAAALQSSCDQYNTGIRIISVRVTKPSIPETVRQNYERIEAQRTELLVAERERELALKRAQTSFEVQKIRIEQDVQEVEGRRRVRSIENQMRSDQQKLAADGQAYEIAALAVAEQKRFTPAFLTERLISSVFNNTKIFFGPNIPTALGGFMSPSALQSLTIPQAAENSGSLSETELNV